ncbi:unnamed protein product [Parascedosporium putredinis]|uniref:F-box domain-containing protein n=1 Tax=Parascedosporium putredinis TaxID=1442378 RepID=A0A9P1GX33_9PEZI|nr:unnamed protein product [Parascedosporium putredinis]CAI7990174.1 unnamed protein product [Parascedosporium putredinis]
MFCVLLKFNMAFEELSPQMEGIVVLARIAQAGNTAGSSSSTQNSTPVPVHDKDLTGDPGLPADVRPRATSDGGSASPARMDPIVAPAYHNLTRSALCRLPDEVLLDIMENLDLTSLMCLRQTSRVFLILFSSPAFKKYHPLGGQRPLELDPALHPLPAQCERFRSLIDKDKFCPECLSARVQGDRNAKLRTLMTRPLHCDTCDVKRPALFFSASQRFSQYAIGKKKKRACLIHEGYMRICQHRVLRWAEVREWIDALARGDGKDFRVTLCGHASHRFTCAGGSPVPYAGIEARLEKDFTTTTLTITWDAHVAIPFRMPTFEEEGFSTTHMRQILETLYLDAGSFIIPEPSAYLPIRMSAFDPNVCACLRYRGREKFDWQLLPRSDIGWKTCRTEPRLNLFTPGRKGNLSGATRAPHSQSVGLRITEFASEHKVPVEWYGLLDPDSYGLNTDDASRHILWCPDASCENYSHRPNHRRFTNFFDRYIDLLKGST